jgi:acyl carrier protein
VSLVQETLTKFIVNELIGSDVTGALDPEENLLITGKVDSIGMMRLVAFIDEQFAFSVPPEDVTIENFMSINKISDYIGRNISA